VFKIPHRFSKVSVHKLEGGVWSAVQCMPNCRNVYFEEIVNSDCFVDEFDTDLHGGNRRRDNEWLLHAG